MLSSPPHGPPPNTITLGLGFNTCILKGHKHRVHKKRGRIKTLPISEESAGLSVSNPSLSTAVAAVSNTAQLRTFSFLNLSVNILDSRRPSSILMVSLSAARQLHNPGPASWCRLLQSRCSPEQKHDRKYLMSVHFCSFWTKTFLSPKFSQMESHCHMTYIDSHSVSHI